MNKIKVLFLAANPNDTERLAIDVEYREITSKIRSAECRDSIEVIPAFAVRPDDMLQLFNQHKPQIVHFSGHGNNLGEIILNSNNGISKPISHMAIKALFTEFKDNIKVVILNACYSSEQAKDITQVIDCAIGMSDSIGDKAAITFAASFYQALGFGYSIKDSLSQGKVALLLEGIPEENTPELFVKSGVDPSQVILIDMPSLFPGANKAAKEFIDYSHYARIIIEEITDELKTSFGHYIPVYLNKKFQDFLINSNDGRKSEPLLAEQIWPNHDHLVILGDPGSGKSCLLNQVAIEIINKSSLIPIIIKAKYWGFSFNTIPQAIKFVLNSYMLNIDDEMITKELSLNKYFILIDGYDEIRISKELFESEILSFIKNDKIKIILTSRTGNYHGELPGFNMYEIKKLNDTQIDKYAKTLISFNFLSHYLYELNLLELARIPLYLFMICSIIAKDGKKLPQNKATLQEEFSSYLLEKSLAKRIPAYQTKYPLQLKMEFLSTLAEKKTLDPLYDNYLECSKEIASISNPFEFMNEILESGILKGNQSSFDFIHPTVREFFYAKQILSYGSDKLFDFLSNHNMNEKFSDIILFLVGLPKDRKKQRGILDFLENSNLVLYIKSLKARYSIMDNINNYSNFEYNYLLQLQRSYNSLLTRYFDHIKFRFFPYSVMPISEIYLTRQLNVKVVGYVDVPNKRITYGYKLINICEEPEPLIMSSKSFSEKFDDGTPFYRSASIRDLDVDSAREMALEDVRRDLRDIIDGRWLINPLEICLEMLIANIKEIASRAYMFCDKSLKPIWKFRRNIYEIREYYDGFNNIKSHPYILIGTTPKWPFDVERILIQLKDLERNNISLTKYVLPPYFLYDHEPLLGENMEKRLVLRLAKMYNLLPNLYSSLVDLNFPVLRKNMQYANIYPFRCFVKYHYGIDLRKKGLIRSQLGEVSVYFKPIPVGETQIACIEKADPDICEEEQIKLRIGYENDLRSLGRYSENNYFRIFCPSAIEIIDNLALTKALYELLIEDLEWFLKDV